MRRKTYLGSSTWAAGYQVSAEVKGPTSRKRDCTVATYKDIINGQEVTIKVVAPQRRRKASNWTRKGM